MTRGIAEVQDCTIRYSSDRSLTGPMTIDYFGRMLVTHGFCVARNDLIPTMAFLSHDCSPDLIVDETDIQTPVARGAASKKLKFLPCTATH